MTNEEMDAAVSGLRTKADKIRKLNELGVERAKIATYLDIRYQHVRNVLVAPTPTKRSTPTSASDADLVDGSVKPLTIDEAKLGLAAQFGVSPTAIEIIIRG